MTRCQSVKVRGKVWRNAVLFTCNYGPGGNYDGKYVTFAYDNDKWTTDEMVFSKSFRRPYEKGLKCKKCPAGDRCFGKLCANTIRDRLVFNPKCECRLIIEKGDLMKIALKINVLTIFLVAKWSAWSGWSKCSVTCGMGKRSRQRHCSTGVQTDCKGFGREVKFCMLKPCTTKSPNIDFNIVLKPGAKLDVSSIMDLFNNRNVFRRPSQ